MQDRFSLHYAVKWKIVFFRKKKWPHFSKLDILKMSIFGKYKNKFISLFLVGTIYVGRLAYHGMPILYESPLFSWYFCSSVFCFIRSFTNTSNMCEVGTCSTVDVILFFEPFYYFVLFQKKCSRIPSKSYVKNKKQ